jgi:hypothetical protein
MAAMKFLALRNPNERWLIDLILLFIPSAPLDSRRLVQGKIPSKWDRNMRANFLNGSSRDRETPPPPAAQNVAGRREKAMSNKSLMRGGGESYSGVVPAKQPNKSGRPRAEVVEGRPLAKENAEPLNLYQTPSRESGPSGLERVR